MRRSFPAVTLCLALLLQGCAAHAPSYARSEAMFGKIQQGMTKEEVLAITGPFDNQMPFPALQQTSFGYYYFDAWGYYCEYSVTFGPEGRVVSKISRRMNDGGSRGTGS